MNKKILFLLLVFITFNYINCKQKQKEFIVAFSSETFIVDPHLTNWATDIDVLDNLFESLVKKRFDFRIEPSLAYRWYNPEPKVWVFDIIWGIRFHNGKELTAEDIVKNFERLKNLSIYSPYIFIVNSIEKVSAEGKYKVKFCLKKRIPDFLIQISDIKIIYISNPLNQNKHITDKKELIGTGPFKIREIAKKSISVERFKRYWREKGKIKKVRFIFNFKLNKSKGIMNSPDIISNYTGKQNKILHKLYSKINKPSNFVYFLVLNPKVEPFSDYGVRKYISSIINKKAIIKKLNIPEDYISDVFVPPWLKHYYAVKKTIVKQKKFYPHINKKIIIVYPYNDFINTVIAKYIYDILRKHGFSNLELKRVTNRGWRYTLFDDGVFSISPFRYATDTGGVDDILVRFFHTRTKYHGVLNIFNYSNKKLDKLIDLGLKETDRDKRYGYFVKAHKMIVEENIFIPLFIKPNVFFIKKSLKIKNFTNIGNLNSIE
jgi:peptide/nickel transport system substrate-binding protein